MKFTPTPIEGLFVIDFDQVTDDRGFFARAFCAEEFRSHGLDPRIAQASISFNPLKGTLRGLHWQNEPHEEAKLVRCTRGSIFDAAVDLRPASPTFRKWFAAELSADNRRMLYIPPGLAHGYQTLEDDTEVSYQMSKPYFPGAADGVRWNDPAFGIDWPLEPTAMAERDRSYPDFLARR